MFGSLEGFARLVSTRWRKAFAPLLAALLLGLLASACGTYVIESKDPVSTANYEVWAMDQTNNIIHIISPQLEVVETVDLSPDGLERTHWINFTSDHKYAWIASTVSGNTAVIRAEDRKLIATFDTGPASHAADIYPDDSGVLVSVIKTGELVEIVSDHAAEAFSIGRRLIIAEDPLVKSRADEFPTANPISSAFTQDGRYAYVTLGPALANGGLVVLDLETFTLVKAYSPEEVRVNLMSVLSPDGAKMFVTGGARDEKSLFYVFDTTTHEVIAKDATRGAEAHGMALTPDGSEIWITNRWTGNVGIMSTEYNDFIERIPFVGEAPDLLAFSPDGVFAFILLRGGGATDAGAMGGVGELPAVVVVSVETRQVVEVLIQGELTDEGELPALDYHGIAIRKL